MSSKFIACITEKLQIITICIIQLLGYRILTPNVFSLCFNDFLNTNLEQILCSLLLWNQTFTTFTNTLSIVQQSIISSYIFTMFQNCLWDLKLCHWSTLIFLTALQCWHMCRSCWKVAFVFTVDINNCIFISFHALCPQSRRVHFNPSSQYISLKVLTCLVRMTSTVLK